MLKTPNPSSERQRTWAVVGGGMLGLSLAHDLAKQGEAVSLFESADELGGLASVWDLNGVLWDRHYHVISMTDTILRSLLDEIGLEKDIQWVETRTGFFSNGKLHSMSNSMEFLKFPPLTLVEKFRLAATIMYASKIKNWRRLEKIPVVKWLTRLSGKGTTEKIWIPLLKAKLGENYKKASAAFIWTTIQRMYKARRTGLKKEMFGYVPGGYANILARMAETIQSQGVSIHLSSKIAEVRRGESGGVSLEMADGSVRQFDQVILTTPSSVVTKICPELDEAQRRLHAGIEYQGIVCASLLLKRSLSPYYVTNITDTWVPLTGIIEMTTIVDRQQFGGNHLIYLPKYVPANDPVFERTDGEIRDTFLQTLEKMYPEFRRDDVVAFRISRVRNVVAVPTIDYSTRLPAMTTGIPGLFVVNSAHILKGNLNVNETIEIARDAMRDLFQPIIDGDGAASADHDRSKRLMAMAPS